MSAYLSYSARGGSGGSGSTINGLSGALTLSPGTGITITDNGSNTITITNSQAPVTIGTANGLSLAGQVLSLALATSSTAGAVANIGSALGVATLDANALIPVTQIPPAALERLVIVADQTARYALTTATVQNGDTVKQTDTNVMYFVIDDTNLGNSAGYAIYTAGTASAVDWSGITNVPSPVSSLSGSNTGDQTITLTGVVTGSGTGSFNTSIANGAIATTMLAVTPTGVVYGDSTGLGTTDPTFFFNDVSKTLNAANFNGALTGNATTVTTNANLTGPITSVGNATAIADGAIATTKLAVTSTRVVYGDSTGFAGTDSTFTFNDTTKTLNATHMTATDFTGALVGNASTATLAATATTATTATNLAGGLGGQIPYQSAVNTTAFLSNGTAGQVLTSAGTTLAPTWGSPSGFTYQASNTSVYGGTHSTLAITGADNIIEGIGAGALLTSGTANTALGSIALAVTITGSNNTALGYGALWNNIGSENTAVGCGALFLNYNGNYNTALGYNALGSLSSNCYVNIGLGANSAYGINAANNALFIGSTLSGYGINTIQVDSAATDGSSFVNKMNFAQGVGFTQIATPANPSASHDKLYFKSDNNLYSLTSAGVETQIGGASSIVSSSQVQGVVTVSNASAGYT